MFFFVVIGDGACVMVAAPSASRLGFLRVQNASEDTPTPRAGGVLGARAPRNRRLPAAGANSTRDPVGRRASCTCTGSVPRGACRQPPHHARATRTALPALEDSCARVCAAHRAALGSTRTQLTASSRPRH